MTIKTILRQRYAHNYRQLNSITSLASAYSTCKISTLKVKTSLSHLQRLIYSIVRTDWHTSVDWQANVHTENLIICKELHMCVCIFRLYLTLIHLRNIIAIIKLVVVVNNFEGWKYHTTTSAEWRRKRRTGSNNCPVLQNTFGGWEYNNPSIYVASINVV